MPSGTRCLSKHLAVLYSSWVDDPSQVHKELLRFNLNLVPDNHHPAAQWRTWGTRWVPLPVVPVPLARPGTVWATSWRANPWGSTLASLGCCGGCCVGPGCPASIQQPDEEGTVAVRERKHDGCPGRGGARGCVRVCCDRQHMRQRARMWHTAFAVSPRGALILLTLPLLVSRATHFFARDRGVHSLTDPAIAKVPRPPRPLPLAVASPGTTHWGLNMSPPPGPGWRSPGPARPHRNSCASGRARLRRTNPTQTSNTPALPSNRASVWKMTCGKHTATQ